MIRQVIYVLLTLSMFGAGVHVKADVLFVDDFDEGLDNWTHVGDGEIDIIEDKTAPSFGPEVLKLENETASNCIAYLENFVLTNGVITYLLKDVDPHRNGDFDADGPGFARLSQEKDQINIATAFPTGYIIEVDLDGGFHILWGDNGNGDNLALDAGISTTDKWTWVKFSLIGNELKGKTWLAGKEEPNVWQLETKDDRYSEGAVAMRVWSGAMHIAHIHISDRDEPYISVQPRTGKLSVNWGLLKR